MDVMNTEELGLGCVPAGMSLTEQCSDATKKKSRYFTSLYRITEGIKLVGRGLWRSFTPTPLLRQSHLQQVIQDHILMYFEYLCGGRYPNLSVQPLLHYLHSKEALPDVQIEPLVSPFVCPHLCSLILNLEVVLDLSRSLFFLFFCCLVFPDSFITFIHIIFSKIVCALLIQSSLLLLQFLLSCNIKLSAN